MRKQRLAEEGNVLICALCTILIISLVGANVLQNCTTRFNVASSQVRSWKEALFAAGAVSSYPKTALAKQAGDELVRDFGFRKLPVRDPYAAPVGAVLVYGGRGAGHVEIRDKTGFVSDFRNQKPSKRRLIGVFAKA